MKILKIKVVNHPDGSMKYPDGFLSIQCLEYLYYDDLATGICWLFVAIEDKDLANIIDMTNVIELTLLQAETLLEKYELKTEEITDEAAVRRIEIKSNSGIALTSEDLKAIDPNDPTPGICYRKRFIDKVKIRRGI